MWLITPTGFFSIVCKPGDKADGLLTVRSKERSDLESLRKYLPSLGTIDEGTGTDYPFRAKAKRIEVAKAVAKMIERLDYQNFKNEVLISRANIGPVSMGKSGMFYMSCRPNCLRFPCRRTAAL